MTKKQWQKAYNIVHDIEEQYGKREGTQPEVAVSINEKYHTNLTENDIANITKQLGYVHTIDRKEEKTVIIFVTETFREHIQEPIEN